MSKYDWVEGDLYYDSTMCQFFGRKCPACGKCVAVCPRQALSEGDASIEIDTERCNQCGDCVSICPSGALGQTMESRQPMVERLQGHEGKVPVLCEQSSWREAIEPDLLSGRRLPADVDAVLVGQIGVLSEVDFAQALLVSRRCVVVLALGENDAERPFAQAANFVGRMAAHLSSEQNEQESPSFVIIIDDAETFWPRIDEIAGSSQRRLLPPCPMPEGERKREALEGILNAWLQSSDCSISAPVVISNPNYATIDCQSEKCTLCGACANHCKVGALRVVPSDNALVHTPIACLNCGVCVAICPDQALTSESGLRLHRSFFSEQTLAKCEALRCSECDRPFTSLKRSQWVSQRLREVRGDDAVREELLRLCPECRAKEAFSTYDEWPGEC